LKQFDWNREKKKENKKQVIIVVRILFSDHLHFRVLSGIGNSITLVLRQGSRNNLRRICVYGWWMLAVVCESGGSILLRPRGE
jgi:hypothetical protein